MKIAVAGASGFVGKALIKELVKNHQVLALSRSVKQSSDKNLEWLACDLFSMLDAEKALRDVDVAIYLVHSMRPSAHLTQGTFDDFDLIVADNFVRAAQKCNVKQIIYLGGMRPEDGSSLSDHLRSRWEVEEVFLKSSVDSTVLRAAIILGADGSSFHMMTRLVKRLPLMVCPSWVENKSQPIALSDVVKSISYCVGNKDTLEKVYDIGGPQPVSYKEMMISIARKMNLKRHFISIPYLTPHLSTMWVCLITGAPRSLVKPLVAGLSTSLLVRQGKELPIATEFLPFEQALDEALQGYDAKKNPLAFHTAEGHKVVRSVQRMELPKKISAEEIAHAYLEYLPTTQPGFLKVDVQGPWIYFAWRFPYIKLLILQHSPERSGPDRQLFYVRGGLLAKKTIRGRLEFREILGGDAIIAAIHDFRPRMPWYIYIWTQAYFHLWVMKQFGRYVLKNKNKDYQKKEKFV